MRRRVGRRVDMERWRKEEVVGTIPENGKEPAIPKSSHRERKVAT